MKRGNEGSQGCPNDQEILQLAFAKLDLMRTDEFWNHIEVCKSCEERLGMKEHVSFQKLRSLEGIIRTPHFPLEKTILPTLPQSLVEKLHLIDQRDVEAPEND